MLHIRKPLIPKWNGRSVAFVTFVVHKSFTPMTLRHILPAFAALLICTVAAALDFPGITEARTGAGRFPLIENGVPAAVVTDPADPKGILYAATNLRADFGRVCGSVAPTVGTRAILAGSLDSPMIQDLAGRGIIPAQTASPHRRCPPR